MQELLTAPPWQVADVYNHLLKAEYFARSFRLADAKAEYAAATTLLSTADHFDRCIDLAPFVLEGAEKIEAWENLLRQLDTAVSSQRIDADAALPIILRLLAALLHLERFRTDASRLKEGMRHHATLAAARRRFLDVQSAGNFGRPVFCIGLSKTGTTTLNAAMTILGYSAAHWTNPLSGDLITPEDAVFFDFMSDIPISYCFEQVYDKFPDARFIYTERDVEPWSRSLESELGHLYDETTFAIFKQVCIFGQKFRDIHNNLYFDHKSPKDAYETFDRRVTDFFKDKPDHKLLRLNIPKTAKWEPLCQFLGLPIPEPPFPWENETPEPRRSR